MAMTNYTSKLVATGAIEGYSGKYVKLYVAYKSTQDAANNKSKVYVGMYFTNDLEIGRWGDWSGSYVGKTTLTFDGTVAAGTAAGTHWLVENKSFDVTHNTEGKATATIYWKWGVDSSWGGMVTPSGSFTITLPTIARASSITTYDSYIGDTTNININKAASSFTHTLQYKIDGQSSYTPLVTKTSASSYKFDTSTIAETAYNLISSTSKYVNCTVKCITYSGSTAIGEKTNTLALVGKDSILAPTLNPTVTDNNETTVNLTGNRAVIIKYYSKPYCFFSAGGKYNASIKSYKVTNGSKSLNTYNGTFEDGVESNVFTFTVTDSRGLTTTKTVTLEKDERFIEAIKPTIAFSTTSPELVTENDATTFKFNLTVKGSCYCGLLNVTNKVNAETRLYYRYREVGTTTWLGNNQVGQGYLLIINSVGENTTGFSADKTSYNTTIEVSGLDYKKAYEIEARIFNTLEAINTTSQVKKTTPAFEWGENDFQFNVPVKLNRTQVSGEAWYSTTNKIGGGLNMGNTDMIGVNSIYFGDMCSAKGEGFGFPNFDAKEGETQTYDYFKCYGGNIGFVPNHPTNTTEYKLCHTKGETLTYNAHTPFAAFLADSSKGIYFSIPLNKPLVGVSGFTVKGKIAVRAYDGAKSNPTSGTAIFTLDNAASEGFTITTTIRNGVLVVKLLLTQALNATTHSVISVAPYSTNLQVTFT